MMLLLFTARNEVGARLFFTGVCDSVHRGGVPDQVHPLGPGTPPWDQVHPRDQVPPPDQVHSPDQVHPRVQVHPPQVHPPDQAHPSPDQVHPPPNQGDTVYVRAVRILLECNLVVK